MTTHTTTHTTTRPALVTAILMVTPEQADALTVILENATDGVSDLEYIAAAITTGRLAVDGRGA